MQGAAAEILTIAFAMVSAGNRRSMKASTVQRLLALTLMALVGAAGGIAGAYMALKIDNAIVQTRLNAVEERAKENSERIWQRELQRDKEQRRNDRSN